MTEISRFEITFEPPCAWEAKKQINTALIQIAHESIVGIQINIYSHLLLVGLGKVSWHLSKDGVA